MSDFVLTAEPRLSVGRDPNVFSPIAGRDYNEVAFTAWLEAQHASLDMDDIGAAIDATQQRIENGTAWFAANDERHPKHERHLWLHSDLRRRKGALLIQLRCAAYACWLHCCETYSALCHVDRDAWMAQYAPQGFRADMPQQIWAVLRGKQPAPGAWPQENSELWIERRVMYVETWNRDELEFQLHERRIAALPPAERPALTGVRG